MEKVNLFSYKKNRLHQIKGFYYTARFRSVSEAARMMNLTQSTVTLQIQSLERDLGLKLLQRGSKPLSLTKEGEDFYKMACPTLHEFESIIEKFLDYKNQEKENKISIAVHHIAISYILPKAIANFKKLYPNSKITLHNINRLEAANRLKNGEIDLAFYPNCDDDPEIENIKIKSYDPILIMHKDHPLANREITNLKELKNFDLIRIDKNLLTLPLFEEIIKTYGLTGSIEFENGNWEMLKRLVKENDFLAVVSTICIDKNDKDLITKRLDNFFPKMRYSVMNKKGSLPKSITTNFINSIKESL